MILSVYVFLVYIYICLHCYKRDILGSFIRYYKRDILGFFVGGVRFVGIFLVKSAIIS